VRLEIYAPDGPLDGDVVVLPPGLGDAPGPADLEALRAYAGAGGKLLGLGDGVAWLCAAALLPGGLDRGDAAAATHVRVEGRATSFTWAIPAGRILALAPSGGARYTATDAEMAALAAGGRIVLRYCDVSGGVARAAASASSVAGVADASGRVLGLLATSTVSLDDELGRQLRMCLASGPEPAARAAPSAIRSGRRPIARAATS
jgi:phosphoribosylformylglycinamidine synthase